MPYKDPKDPRRIAGRADWERRHPNWRQEWREKNPNYAKLRRPQRRATDLANRQKKRAGRIAARAVIAKVDAIWALPITTLEYTNSTPEPLDAHYSRNYAERKLGATPGIKKRLIAAQNGLCAICRQNPLEDEHGRAFHLDHDHATGKIRAALCMNCNQALGKFKDNPRTMRAAADYIERHKAPQN